MNGHQWPSFKHWLLNIVQQNLQQEQQTQQQQHQQQTQQQQQQQQFNKRFEAVLQHLPESLDYFLLKQWHEVATSEQLDTLVHVVLDYCGLKELPHVEVKRRHAPKLKIRGLLWR